jgi:lipid II:glycine glycyltransferase (peptidoglycan interpeptide bridge formation enzyme)
VRSTIGRSASATSRFREYRNRSRLPGVVTRRAIDRLHDQKGCFTVDAARWDSLLSDHDGHLLQSWAWGAFKHQHGWRPERIAVDGRDGVAMAQVLFRHRGPVSVGYIPRGPVLAGNRAALWTALRHEIDRAARRHRAVAVIIEGNCAETMRATRGEGRLRPVGTAIQPLRTVKVPLLDDDALLGQMHQKTRYNVRLAGRRGVAIGAVEPDPANLAGFYALLRETSARNGFQIHPERYYRGVLDAFGGDAALFRAVTAEGDLAAAVIVARFGDEAIYLYGASSTEHRAHGAGLAIQFEAMKWAREGGATVYDLWGIPRQDPDSTTTDDHTRIAGTHGKDWRGLYRFKTGFGGDIVGYPDAVERRYLPVVPALARRLGLIPG